MMKLLLQSLRMLAGFTLLTGLAYPLVVTVLARLAFPVEAGGSLVRLNGNVAGSALLAQKFEDPRFFQARPSAADYAAVPSGASNLGPIRQALHASTLARAGAFRAANGLPPEAPVPAALLTASGSGLDPHIPPACARLQAMRVASARGMDPAGVETLIARFTEPPQFGFLGEPRVNVLLLNLALDRQQPGAP
ncbi:MAG: potassium-transporting ATPase subunit KdpC [Kiritimatiellia bacterium]